MRTIGLGVTPIDVEVGAGSVWVLSDQALLRVDPAINHVVATVPLPRASGAGQLVPSGGRRECRLRLQLRVSWQRRPRRPCHDIRRDRAQKSPSGRPRTGEGALWAITGWEQDTIERIDPKTNAVVETFRSDDSARPVAGVIAWPLVKARPGCWPRVTVEGRCHDRALPGECSAPPQRRRQHRDRRTERSGSRTRRGCCSVSTLDSQAVAKTIPLGTLVYPVESGDALAVGEGSVWVAVTSIAS